jgi:hypothetical protein
MDIWQIFGIAMVVFGVAMGILRVGAPQHLKKLGPMQQQFGPVMGGMIHFIAYTILPIAGGAVLIFGGGAM